ncbi:MAG: PDDEXK nuclease domain-containing protein [Candidatus Obscuribacterales bacterium]|jgi:predicted nuclease of restriction endonuclease-like (RecB) superfamily|nr:PDDEXK nuclease domain-containing protein [Candidatus Obscuribacterales bacterium]
MKKKKPYAQKLSTNDLNNGATSGSSSQSLVGYAEFFSSLKQQIQEAQLRAAASVNAQVIEMYYNIGKAIVQRQEDAGWGDSILERLSKDLTSSFPEMKGFSQRNLYRMRSFYLAYRDSSGIFATAVAKIPWGHNSIILDKAKDPQERSWYVAKTAEYGWSRSILELQIEQDLYNRQGSAITNFSRTLPSPQSDLANQLLKDPYNFDFLSLDAEAHERDIEKSLVDHIQHFLIELGVGFAFVGRQYHLDIGEQDFFLDLLFYHLRLRCYVVIELKSKEFKPEYAGKLNFYLSAVDDILRHPDDKPSIGLLLCKSKNKLIAEYALRGIDKPIGISEIRLTESLPESMKGSLPTIEELELKLNEIPKTSRSDD